MPDQTDGEDENRANCEQVEDDFRRELSELPKADFPPIPDGPITLTEEWEAARKRLL